MNEELMKQKLIKIAREECFIDNEDEDVLVYDVSGSNVDDAFDMGEDQGRILLAREVLFEMGIDWS
jgi:hypothetical protein